MTVSQRPPGRLLKPREVMARLSCSESHLYELVARGQIDSLKDGRSRRFSERAVDEYIERLEAATRASA